MKLPLFARHFEELSRSAIAPALCDRNFYSLDGEAAVERLLYGRLVSRQRDGTLATAIRQRYAHLAAGAWGCRSLDPFAGWQEMGWTQLKPDRPQASEGSERQSFEAPLGEPSRAYLLDVPRPQWDAIAAGCNLYVAPDETGNFWQWLLAHPEVPLFLTAGSTAAASLLSAGYAAIGIPRPALGWYPRGTCEHRQLLPELALFAPGRACFLAFGDTAATPQADILGQLLWQQGLAAAVKRVSWSALEECEVDRLVALWGIGAFARAAIAAADVLEFPLDAALSRGDAALDCQFLAAGERPEAIALHLLELQQLGRPAIFITRRERLAHWLAARFGVGCAREWDEEGSRILTLFVNAPQLGPGPGREPAVIFDLAVPIALSENGDFQAWQAEWRDRAPEEECPDERP